MRALYLSAELALCPMAAHAQIPVTDVAGLGEQIVHYGQMLLGYARQGQQLAQEAQLVAQQATMIENFIHNPSLGYAMGLMGQAGLQNPLPVDPYTVQSMLQGGNGLGGGGLNGITGMLGTFSNASLGSNNYYTSPGDNSYAAQSLAARMAGAAGAQGMSMNLLHQISAHLPVMQALRDKLNTASSPKDVQDAQAALATETAWTNNIGAQAQTLAVMQQAQLGADRARDDQRLNKSFDDSLAKVHAAGDW